MGIYEVILERRTIRKFKQQKIGREILQRLVNAARLAPSAANMQPLKYIIADGPEKVREIFKFVRWAGYIAPEGDPKEGEEPVAYIVILVDTNIRKSGYELDIGAAAQNIILSAWEEGIGTCWMGAIEREKIKEYLKISDNYIVNTVIALGYKAENPVIEEMADDPVKYYKDDNGVLHVPKRKFADIIVE